MKTDEHESDNQLSDTGTQIVACFVKLSLGLKAKLIFE